MQHGYKVQTGSQLLFSMGDCVSTVPPNNQPLNKPPNPNQPNNNHPIPEQQPMRKQQGMKVFPQISAATEGSKVQQPRANSSFSEVKLNASSSNFSLTESHKEKMRFQVEVVRASEIENSRLINKLAEQSQISQNNSIWNSNLHVATQRNTFRQEGAESNAK